MFGDTKQKYVKLDRFNEIIIFPCVIEHSDFKDMKPISAGFCYVKDNEVNCFGESVSLGIKSDEKDSSLATKQIFGWEAMEALENKLEKSKESVEPKDELSKSSIPKKIFTAESFNDSDDNYLTVGKLKSDIEKYNIPDSAIVATERVQDFYYDRNGWGVILRGGYWYESMVRTNARMNEEIERRKRGEESEYPDMDDPSKYILDNESLEEHKSQYTPAFCSFSDDDKDFLFINLHH